MYFTNKELPNTVISALKRAKVQFNERTDCWFLYLPEMERESYGFFKKVLIEIHGEWNRSLSAHVFSFDPTDLIQEVLTVGRMPKRNPHDAFFTQRDTLEYLLDWGDFYCLTAVDGRNVEPDKCLEPEAGQGHIAEVLREMYPNIDLGCCEIDSFNRSILKKKGFRVIAEDFLAAKIEPVYDWVVMNPPFNGKHGDYIDHINKAFDEALVPRGRLLAIVPTSFLSSNLKRVENFRNKIATYGEWANLPENSFAKSGTQVDTCMIKVEKYTDEDLKKFESPGQMYGAFDIYTGPIVRDISSEAEFDEHICKLVKSIKNGKSVSKKDALVSIIGAVDSIVRYNNEHHETSYRWDDFTKPRVAQYFLEDMVEGHFDDRSPFESSNPEPMQLSLFG